MVMKWTKGGSRRDCRNIQVFHYITINKVCEHDLTQ